MPQHRKLLGTLLLASLAVMPLAGAAPAHAAVGGTIKAGPGASGSIACSTTITCAAWFFGCSHKDVTQNANDLDASIRSVAGMARTLNYSWSTQQGSAAKLVIEGYDANCSVVPNNHFELAAHSGSFTLGSAVTYVFVTGNGPFANLTWSLG